VRTAAGGIEDLYCVSLGDGSTQGPTSVMHTGAGPLLAAYEAAPPAEPPAIS
jgi:hypothetical protein